MNSVCKELFKAIHQGLWLSIEYKNMDNQITRYWIGIKRLEVASKTLVVDGLHLANKTLCELKIFIDSILSASVVKGTYCKINDWLINDIATNPHKYKDIFGNSHNLKILNYFIDCHRLDTVPYKTDYKLLQNVDAESFSNGTYTLTNDQFIEIVNTFQYETKNSNSQLKIKQLCLNVLSINTPKGLYVLAYRKLNLDIKLRQLVADESIIINKEYTIEGERQSINFYLDADDYNLLDNFEENSEIIKDKITKSIHRRDAVDDMPYVIALGFDLILDLNSEYSAIVDMYNENKSTKPIDAFFGKLHENQKVRKELPIVLANKKINLDQLRAIRGALKYPLTYVQGPPGTGKTNTIVNTILSLFFNERKVLFSSYNNHPIDSVFEQLISFQHKGKTIPFPVVRLGNNDIIPEALKYVRELYESMQAVNIYDTTLSKYKEEQIERTKKLTILLEKYGEKLDLLERKDALTKMISSTNDYNFSILLQSGQLNEVESKLKDIGDVTNEDALNVIAEDFEELFKYMYYISAKHIKRLKEQKYDKLRDIIYTADKDVQIKSFNEYMSDSDNVSQFLRVFPIIITTCASARKIGEPVCYFDNVIIDEASQCNTAVSLVPILRGKSLMLVGDPQQLKPVILLDQIANEKLKKRYNVPPEYDYINNSIYQVYLATDSISDEILLSHHYRCHKKIIEFNNKKFYNGKLKIKSDSTEEEPLLFENIQDSDSYEKNTSVAEANYIVKLVKNYKDKKIAIITPFVNQKKLVTDKLEREGLSNILCGTVHSFQGDEKDIIIFSLAITKNTNLKTYNWLKNNKELINVAVSRAKDKFIMLANKKEIERLHSNNERDDIYELMQYVISNGKSEVTELEVASRALGVKPYSTKTEEAFMTNLNHALQNISIQHKQCEVRKEVPISQVFQNDDGNHNLFYTGRFDFVIFDKRSKLPIFAIELDGLEHFDDSTVRARDKQKQEICEQHNFQLIRVENCYARRYEYIKDILMNYFAKA